MKTGTRWLCLLLLATALLNGGCMTATEWDRFWSRKDPRAQEPDPIRDPDSAAVKNTIGPLVSIEGLRLNQLRGFGLVVDLVDTGGRDGPDIVRKHLVKEIRRNQTIGGGGAPALDVINSRDSAMVEITGYVPPGAKKGDRFDIVVRALGSEAKSLVGGRLFLGQLKMFAETPSGVLGSKTLATAEGPVFVSPFNPRGRRTDKIDLRKGFVLGGGEVSQPRKLRLVLHDPRASVARRIALEINSRYSGSSPIAVGERSSHVAINIPDRYLRRKRVFLERLLHTPMDSRPASLKRRVPEIIAEFEEPEANFNSLGLAIEAIGKIALTDLRPLYEHESQEVSYYAARSGLRLEDKAGMETVIKHARNSKSDFRKQAINELGWALRMYPAGEALRHLLSDDDEEIRIAAYKALRKRRHPAIASALLDRDNFILDVVESKGPYLIYAERIGKPRIAIFGRNMRCRPPAMFPGDRRDGRRFITQLSAMPRSRHLDFVFHGKRSGRTYPKVNAPLKVSELVRFLGGTPDEDNDGKLTGYAVPYSEIIDILAEFCETKTIRAKLVIQRLDEGDPAANEREETEY